MLAAASNGPSREIWLVLPDFSGGGAERQVLSLVRQWPADLPSVRVIVRRGKGELVEQFRVSGVAITNYALGARSGPVVRVAGLALLTADIRRGRPRGIVSFLSPVSTWLSTVLARGGVAPAATAVIAAVQNPVAQLEGGTEVGRRLRRNTVIRSLSAADAVVPTAPGLAHELIRLGVPKIKVNMIPNGVDLPAFSRPRRAALHPKIAVVARIHPQKRLDIALRAFAEAAEPGWTLEIAGVGPHLAQMQRLSDQLGLSKQVTFSGFVEDVPQFLSDKHCLLVSSDYEGFGNVIIEALAAGIPVVSTDVPYGPSFILADDRSLGRLVPPRDPYALAMALREVLSDDPRSPENESERRKRAEDFSAERIAAAWFDLLRAFTC